MTEPEHRESNAKIVAGLRGRALLAAQRFLSRHPDALLTSGKRDLESQCRAMAQNIVKSGNRKWIAETYKASSASKTAQAWVTTNPGVVSVLAIAAGLFSVLSKLAPDALRGLSLHLSGDAWDVLPTKSTIMLQSLREVVAEFGGKFIEREGGLVVWHAQF